MALHFLYRKSSGQVLGVSVNSYGDGLPTDLAAATDPTLTDGDDLATPKVYDAGTVRNATQEEIDGFADAEEADAAAARKALAKAAVDADNLHGRILRAVLTLLLNEINTLRTNAGLSSRTAAQVKTAILNAMESE